MERIPVYSDMENLVEVFSIKRDTNLFIGMRQFLGVESEIFLCESEEVAVENQFFPEIAKEFSAGNFKWNFRKQEEDFLCPPFKTNLQEKFQNKSSILFSYDSPRITEFRPKNGLLMAGIGEETMVYNHLNFNRESCKAFRFLIPGVTFMDYSSLEPFILPFNEIIINEPYLFLPDRDDWDLNNYIKYNFIPLVKSLFKNTKNKVNIVICTFVNDDERVKLKFPYFDLALEQKNRKGFTPLYELCNSILKDLLGGARYNLWLVISPMARKARHDRYIVTNYQYIESGSGFAFFDDKGKFENRGEKIELFSILDDQTRKDLIPTVIKRLQEISLNQTKAFNPNRIFGTEQGNSYYLNFT